MYHIIVNPASRSGKGAKIWAMLEPVLKEKQVTYLVHYSEKSGHIIQIIRELSLDVFSTDDHNILKLIVLGGDGTFNEALQGITDFERTYLGYIPTGSSNDMARDIYDAKDPISVLNRILSCKEPTRMDLGHLTINRIDDELPRTQTEKSEPEHYFGVSCGLGFDAAVCEEILSSKLKKIMNKLGLGKLTYLGIALKQLFAAKKVSCEITLDDKQTITLPRFLFVAGMVHQYEGGGFMFCPGADFHDGIMDICLVGNVPKLIILLALPTAFKGKHYLFKGVDKYTARKMTVKTASPLWLHTDGEVFAKTDSITLTCEKEKLQILL